MLQIYEKVFMETSVELVFANIANFRRSLTSNSHKTYFKSHIPALTIHHISTAWPGALNPATHPMPGKSRPAYPMSSKATGAYFPRRPGPPRPPSPPPCKKTRPAMPLCRNTKVAPPRTIPRRGYTMKEGGLLLSRIASQYHRRRRA